MVTVHDLITSQLYSPVSAMLRVVRTAARSASCRAGDRWCASWPPTRRRHHGVDHQLARPTRSRSPGPTGLASATGTDRGVRRPAPGRGSRVRLADAPGWARAARPEGAGARGRRRGLEATSGGRGRGLGARHLRSVPAACASTTCPASGRATAVTRIAEPLEDGVVRARPGLRSRALLPPAGVPSWLTCWPGGGGRRRPRVVSRPAYEARCWPRAPP